ncbi:MAG: ABC transporter ATP-binding protein [Alphaproteobacteria bacterium]
MSGLAALAPSPEPSADAAPPLLRIAGLCTEFVTDSGTLPVVSDFSLDLRAGETVGIVGESGCGKSITALSITRLLPPSARIASGRIEFLGHDLARLSERDMRSLRGNDLAMIFQEPMTALNPVLTIGRQLVEPIVLHQGLSNAKAWARAVEMLRLVRIPDPERRVREYPHQLSGGMRQRVMIAMALSCNPKLLIADEPTTALDVTIQAQILQLIVELKQSLGMTVLLITHDLGVVAQTCQRVAVMYAGRKVEEAPVAAFFARPLHPYSRGLLGSVPKLQRGRAQTERGGRLAEIAGMVPALGELGDGCAFAPRCAMATAHCRRHAPPLEHKAPDHSVACWEAPRVG